MNRKVIGCDIGGSHITAAIVDFEAEQIVENSYARLDVNSSGDSESIVSQWAECIETAANGYLKEELLVAIAVPGPFDYEQGICYINGQNKYDALYKIDVKSALATRLGIATTSIRFVNDAASFLHGEISFGIGKGYERAIGLTLGTGLGSAVYVNGESVDADLWQTPFKEGIAENYLSARWLTNSYAEKAAAASVFDVKQLAQLSGKNDEVAKSIFLRFGDHLLEFIETELLKFDPEVIILGGNISKAMEFFFPPGFRKDESGSAKINIVSAALGEHSALYGAARMSFEEVAVSEKKPRL